MAIYHFEMKKVSRSRGSSSIAKLAYITGEKFRDERAGETRDYPRKERVLGWWSYCPEGTPEEWQDNPGGFWNALESAEKSDRACIARSVDMALPRECTPEQWGEILDDFCAPITDMGYYCTLAIHEDRSNQNPHAHLLIANRRINPETGELEQTKTKKVYARDKDGNKIPLIDPKTGEQKVRVRKGHGAQNLWKMETVSKNPIDTKEFLLDCRKRWADCCNARLDRDHQIDHRSLKAQDAGKPLQRMPTQHEGYAARKIERNRPGHSWKIQENREIAESNNALLDLLDEILQFLEQKDVRERNLARLEQARTSPSRSRIASAIQAGADAHDQKKAGRGPHRGPYRGPHR